MSAKARLTREINGLRDRILSMRIARAIDLESVGIDASKPGSVVHSSDPMIGELSSLLRVKQRGLLELIAK
jgi:hypothetical protein